MRRRALAGAAAACIAAGLASGTGGAAAQPEELTAWVLTKDGRSVEGVPRTSSLTLTASGTSTRHSMRDVRSFHSADPATPSEAAKISSGLTSVEKGDRKASETAAAELADIGLPVLSPLLAAYRDRDGREPDPLYRLFERIIPGYADGPDRSLDLLRLKGKTLRGKLKPVELSLQTANGRREVIPGDNIRRLAIRQPSVDRTFELQSLRHCTYVGFLDTGAAVTPASELTADSEGFVRLSFDEDGWASDPDGIHDPLPGKRRLQEGFRWGAVLGRVGPSGERWLAGKHVEKRDLGAGRLYFVVNDNEHWQNNVGSYRVRLRVTNAYDIGEPQ